MADKQSLNNIFQRYLNNECSTYEIKYLLKHFISGSNDTLLREIIADKLKDHSVDEHLHFQHKTFFLDDTFKDNIRRLEPKAESVGKIAGVASFFTRAMFIKILAIVTLVLL